MKTRTISLLSALLLTSFPLPLLAHEAPHHAWNIHPHFTSGLISGPAHHPREIPPAVKVEKIHAEVEINGHLAITTLTYTFSNAGGRPVEAVVMVPVPPAAAVREFSIEGMTTNSPAELLPKEEARRIYDETVRRMIDPGLLEFAGLGLIRSSVFPVPPGKSTSAKLVYEEVLAVDHGQWEYVLPRTENPTNATRWTISLRWRMPEGMPNAFCPTHEVASKSLDPNTLLLQTTGIPQPGTFKVVAQAPADAGPSLTVTTYPPEGDEDGYFLIALAPPGGEKNRTLPRDVTVVIDRSGSMAGEKLDVVKSAVGQIIEGLDEVEKFNLVAYNESVSPFSKASRPADRESILLARNFIKGMKASGGTNIHDALAEALAAPVTPGHLPVVLFLTDGLPTVSETKEKIIRQTAARNNRDQRRIFTIGVGADVNTPLLASLADDSRATATFLLPGEDMEMKMVAVFQRLAGPRVSEVRLLTSDMQGKETAGDLSDLIPSRIPDLFAAETRLLVGRWKGKDPIGIKIQGTGAAGLVEAKVKLDPAQATTRHAYIPRIWATRKMGLLTQALRDLGEDGRTVDSNDPRARELIDEIVKLSIKHGVLSEYTAFLAKDGEVFGGQNQHRGQTWENVRARAIPMRSGMGAMNQEMNSTRWKESQSPSKANSYLDANLHVTETTEVQQMADRTFYKNQGRWTDSRINANTATRTAAIGSPEFDGLVDRLVATNRQSLLSLPGELVVEVDGIAWTITPGASRP